MHEDIRRGIAAEGFSFCTPIQAYTLPIALEGRDVAGQAQTGTGKTAAFLIAAYQNILKSPDNKNNSDQPKQPRIFILAPTRELAIPIAKDAASVGQYTNLKIADNLIIHMRHI